MQGLSTQPQRRTLKSQRYRPFTNPVRGFGIFYVLSSSPVYARYYEVDPQATPFRNCSLFDQHGARRLYG
jgi:hypothetical protein